MLKFFLDIFERYGFGILQLALLAYVSWKLFTNHLHHIMSSLDGLNNKICSLEKTCNNITERIATIEGRLDAKSRKRVKKSKED